MVCSNTFPHITKFVRKLTYGKPQNSMHHIIETSNSAPRIVGITVAIIEWFIVWHTHMWLSNGFSTYLLKDIRTAILFHNHYNNKPPVSHYVGKYTL